MEYKNRVKQFLKLTDTDEKEESPIGLLLRFREGDLELSPDEAILLYDALNQRYRGEVPVNHGRIVDVMAVNTDVDGAFLWTRSIRRRVSADREIAVECTGRHDKDGKYTVEFK